MSGPESLVQSLFVPDSYVPLSEFSSGTTTLPGQPLELHVTPAILNQAGSVLVARNDAGVVSYLSPSQIDYGQGIVSVRNPGPHDYVVVSDSFKNVFPIVTHWKSRLNDWRGGHSLGASDGIATYLYDANENKIVSEGGSTLSQNDWAHQPSGEKYFFATDQYALFSDGSEQTAAKDGEWADADVPAYERYVGENWEIAAIDESAAIWLSDWSRENTGYPVAHRNHVAFDTTVPVAEQVMTNVPLFQVVHGYLVDPGDDPAQQGHEQSLAAFILPPTWTPPQPPPSPPGHPVLFNGSYGTHNSTFGQVGQKALQALGDLYNDHGALALGVFWNGGGGQATLARQASAYRNAAKLISDAELLGGANPHGLVIFGGSRGDRPHSGSPVIRTTRATRHATSSRAIRRWTRPRRRPSSRTRRTRESRSRRATSRVSRAPGRRTATGSTRSSARREAS